MLTAARFGKVSHIWEVDHPATQTWKRERLAATGIAVPATLTFAPVNFEPCESLAAGSGRRRLRRGEADVLHMAGRGALSHEGSDLVHARIHCGTARRRTRGVRLRQPPGVTLARNARCPRTAGRARGCRGRSFPQLFLESGATALGTAGGRRLLRSGRLGTTPDGRALFPRSRIAGAREWRPCGAGVNGIISLDPAMSQARRIRRQPLQPAERPTQPEPIAIPRALLWLALLFLLLNLGALACGFVFDDAVVLVGNASLHVHSLGELAHIWKSGYIGPIIVDWSCIGQSRRLCGLCCGRQAAAIILRVVPRNVPRRSGWRWCCFSTDCC